MGIERRLVYRPGMMIFLSSQHRRYRVAVFNPRNGLKTETQASRFVTHEVLRSVQPEPGQIIVIYYEPLGGEG